ncbi:hypothetical protein OY671_000884 [Metschnikowia pulcherrima]|nr:hypothetical protein OY671_000884 [Metschnikowia pulcherrima]
MDATRRTTYNTQSLLIEMIQKFKLSSPNEPFFHENFMSPPRRYKYTAEQKKSPNFRLPPLESSAPIIKYGLYTWEVEPYVENQERRITVSCAFCSHYHPSVTWPINTTNFLAHTKRKHSEIFATLPTVAIEALSIRGPDFATPQNNNILSYFSPDASLENPEIPYISPSPTGAFASTNKRPRLAEFDPEHLKVLLLDVMMSAKVPLAFVDGQAMQRLLQYLKNDVPMISSGMLEDFLDDYFFDLVSAFKATLARVEGRFAISIHEWKAASSNSGFFAVTVHYFDENFTLKTDILSFENMHTVLRTGDSLFDHFMNILKDHQIEDRVVSITRGITGPMDVLMDRLERQCDQKGLPSIGDVPCAGQVLNSAAMVFLEWIFFTPTKLAGLDEDIAIVREMHVGQESIFERMALLASFVRDVARKVNDVPYLQDLFASIVVKNNKKEAKKSCFERSVRSNTTRWFSTLEMIRRFVYYREEISKLLEKVASMPLKRKERFELQNFEFRNEDWEYLSFVCGVLESFEEPASLLESYKDISASFTLPYVYDLLKDLRRREDHDMAQNNPLLERGLKEARLTIVGHYPLGDVSENIPQIFGPIKNLFLATVLDPRAKLQLLVELGLSETILLQIKNHVREVFEQYKLKNSGTENEEIVTESQLEKIRSEIVGARFFCGLPETKKVRDELSIYLSQERLNAGDSVSAFYHPQNTRFPILSLVARDFLAIPAMSTPTESLFPGLSEMVSKKGNGLLSSTMRTLAILKHRGQITEGVEALFRDKSGAEVAEKSGKISRPERPVYITPDHEAEFLDEFV